MSVYVSNFLLVKKNMSKIKICLENKEEEILESEELSDHTEIFNEIQEQDAAVSRATDISAALEDLANIVRTMKIVTPSQLNLIKVSANMAVAGTNINAQSILPGMESFNDSQVAAEGFMDKVKETGKKILDFIIKIFIRVGDFIKSVFYHFKGQKARLEKMTSTVDKLISGNKEISVKEIVISNPPKTITIKGKLPADFNEYTVALDSTARYLYEFPKVQAHIGNEFAKVLTSGIDYLNKYGNQIKTGNVIRGFGIEDPIDNFYNVFKDIKLDNMAKALKLKEAPDESDKSVIKAESINLLGDQNFIFKYPKTLESNSGSDKTKYVLAHKFYFEKNQEYGTHIGESKMDTPHLQIVKQSLLNCKYILDSGDEMEKIIDKQTSKVLKSIRDIYRIAGVMNTGTLGQYFKCLSHVSMLISRLTTQPVHYCNSVVYGALFLCDKATKNYGDYNLGETGHLQLK